VSDEKSTEEQDEPVKPENSDPETLKKEEQARHRDAPYLHRQMVDPRSRPDPKDAVDPAPDAGADETDAKKE
jgi:hypothetical protein